MNIKKMTILFSAAMLLITIMAACSPKEAALSKVRVAFFPNITHAQALVGKKEGQFQKAVGSSVKVEWKQFNAGPSEIEALFAGEIDIGYIGPTPAINGYAKSNGDLQIIAGATDAGAILVTRKDLKLTGIKELSGKKVAIPQFGNTQDFTLRYLLQQNGLKDTTKGGTVEIHQAENPDIKTLLDKGDIDAALVPEPWGSRLVKEINANVLLDYKDIMWERKYPTAIVIVRTEFLKKHPDIVEKFLKTHVEITDFINKNPEQAKTIVNEQIKAMTQKALAKDVLDDAFKRLILTNDPEQDAILEFVDISVKSGALKTKPDTGKLFNLELLNKITGK